MPPGTGVGHPDNGTGAGGSGPRTVRSSDRRRAARWRAAPDRVAGIVDARRQVRRPQDPAGREIERGHAAAEAAAVVAGDEGRDGLLQRQHPDIHPAVEYRRGLEGWKGTRSDTEGATTWNAPTFCPYTFGDYVFGAYTFAGEYSFTAEYTFGDCTFEDVNLTTWARGTSCRARTRTIACARRTPTRSTQISNVVLPGLVGDRRCRD